MKYRSDIDGLRAVAVLPVVGFHYEFNTLFPGGFVGVDIFFVISGFLITKIIFDGFAAGTYSVVDFYDRRIRRIFPALFAMFLFVLVGASFLRFPLEIIEIGTAIVSSIFFVSNILFFTKSGYFDGSSATNPVLHTWSLSVEEQFYIVFPAILFALRGFSIETKKRAILLVFAASLAAAIVTTPANPQAAFYLVPYRAWELLAGSLLAIGVFPAVKRSALIDAIAAAGFLAIAAAIVLFSKKTLFPGAAAIVPCAGAAMIIYAGSCGPNWVSRALSVAPIRFLGQISYSLYLWHWPIFVFASDLVIVDRKLKIMLVLVAVAVSAASWWFIERPFREKPYRLGRRGVLTAAGFAMAGMAGAALLLPSVSEAVRPFPDLARQAYAYESYNASTAMRGGQCFLSSEVNSFSYYDKEKCLALAAGKRNVLIIGDSHAAHLWAGYSDTLEDINFIQATASGCRPLKDPQGERRCTDLINFTYNNFLPGKKLDAIILSARWEDHEVDAAVATAAHLRQHASSVILSGPIHEYERSLPRILAAAVAKGEDPEVYAAKYLLPVRAELDRKFALRTMPDNVAYISVHDVFCDSTCRVWAEPGVPLQFDYGHLTKAGAAALAKAIGSRYLALDQSTSVVGSKRQ